MATPPFALAISRTLLPSIIVSNPPGVLALPTLKPMLAVKVSGCPKTVFPAEAVTVVVVMAWLTTSVTVGEVAAHEVGIAAVSGHNGIAANRQDGGLEAGRTVAQHGRT